MITKKMKRWKKIKEYVASQEEEVIQIPEGLHRHRERHLQRGKGR